MSKGGTKKPPAANHPQINSWVSFLHLFHPNCYCNSNSLSIQTWQLQVRVYRSHQWQPKALTPFHSVILRLLEVLRWLIHACRQPQIKSGILCVSAAIWEARGTKWNKNYLIWHTFGCKMSAAGNCSSPQTNISSEILLRNCHLSASTALLISRNLPKTWMFVFRELLLI